jgi:YkoY family integral membrane protein
MVEYLQYFLGNDYQTSLSIIGSLIIIESLLSIDNAAVLATMVKDLPKNQQGKALKYGIIGAYVFRGICLLLASFIVTISWLKLLGGLYLLWLTLNYFYTKATPQEDDDLLNKNENFIYKFTLGRLGTFWATVVLIEFMDLTFSIDNVLAAAAYTKNLYLICIGVFIGMLAMRFSAQIFVWLLRIFPFLEAMAFIVIALLGVKLILSFACEFFKNSYFCTIVNGHEADMYTSIITLAVFTLPILTSLIFNYPQKSFKKAD